MHYLRWTLKARAKVCSKGENSIIFITLFTPADVLIAWYLSKLQSSWFLCREDTCRSIKFHRIVPDHLCDIFLLSIWPDYISTSKILDIDFTEIYQPFSISYQCFFLELYIFDNWLILNDIFEFSKNPTITADFHFKMPQILPTQKALSCSY